MPSRVRFPLLSTIAFVAFVIVAVIWWPAKTSSPPTAPAPDPVAPRTRDAPRAATPPTDSVSREETVVQSAAALVLRIEAAQARLLALAERNASLSERAAAVDSLRIELRAPGQRASAEAIALFLESGRDAPTGFTFAPEPGGGLAQAPTLRTLLLDELERLDLARAREAAEQVFAATQPNAEEWSLALRITAHADRMTRGAADALFVRRVQTFLENAAWQNTPSAGYVHGFDAAVFSGDLAHVDTLARLGGADAPAAVRFAARLALDRMIAADFAGVGTRLLDQPALLADDPQVRGMLLARADVSDPAARGVLEKFLSNDATTAAELASWTEYFPHRSKHISDNLLTSDRPIPIAELARMDRAALDVVRAWRADPAFRARDAELATVQERLERFVASADRGTASQ